MQKKIYNISYWNNTALPKKAQTGRFSRTGLKDDYDGANTEAAESSSEFCNWNREHT